MDINTARIVRTRMQECFVEFNLPIVTESKKDDQEESSDFLVFLSQIAINGFLAPIQASVWLDSELIQLSIFFEQELSDATMPKFLALMNEINLSSPGGYWVAIPGFQKIEFHTAYVLPGALNKEQFKGVLQKFLDQGLNQHAYFKKMMNPEAHMN